MPALEEVIVTSTRRSEDILRIPVSVTALGTDDLVKSAIKSINDLSFLVPGITYESAGFQIPAASNITIRGVVSSSGDPTTGIYLDETALQGSTATGGSNGHPYPAVFDLNRVEVLRGPQGTL